ncbi:MAG: phage tail tube protein [Thermodesulfobacteriota bacterium]
MTQAMGVSGRLAYQVETTFKITPATPALKLAYFLSESLGEKINLVTSQVIRSNRNPTKPVRGNRDASGALKTELAPSLGTLLKAALGSNTTTGAGSPYTHTMKIGSLPSLTFEKGFTDLGQYLLFNGCKVNRMSLSVKPEGFQEIDLEFMGANEAQALPYDGQTGNFTVGQVVTGGTSTATGTIIADSDAGTEGFLTLINVSGTFQNNEAITDPITGAAVVNGTLGATPLDSSVTDPGHSPWDGFAVSTLQEGGSDIAVVTAVDLSLENDLDGDSYVVGGGGVRQSLSDGKAKVSGTLTALFDSMTLYNKAIKYTESSLKIVYKHGTGAGTAGNEYLEILVPELYFSKETPAIEGPKGVLFKGPFEAFYDNGADASAMKIVLMNAEATI